MADPARILEAKAPELAEKDRAELARVLLLSLGDPQDQETWAQEAERRYQELRAGAVQAVPSDKVLEEARCRLE